MLRRAVNEIEFTVDIEGKSPLLVRDGRDEFKKERIFISRDTEAVVGRALETGHWKDLKYYLPGSSVRGSWRSHLEKVLRSLDSQERVCDPFADAEGAKDADVSCSRYYVRRRDGAKQVNTAYQISCPVCRLFGNMAQGSRLAFSDGEKLGGRAESITNVAINRQTGSVKSPFSSVVLVGAKFQFKLRLRNFELWHLGLLGHLFDDLAAEMVPLGYAKSKGLGKIAAKASQIRFTYFGRQYPCIGGLLPGLWELCEPVERERYQLMQVDNSPSVAATMEEGSALWRHSRKVNDVKTFWGTLKPYFDATLWSEFDSLGDRRTAEVKDGSHPAQQG